MNTQGNLLPATTPSRVAIPPIGYVNEFRNSDDNLYYGKKSDGSIELIAGAPSSGVPYGVAAGTDTYTTVLNPDPTPLTIGQQINVKFVNANTGASTLNANGSGAISLTTGGNPLQPNELVAGEIYEIVYDGTNLEVTGVANQNGIISKTHAQLSTLKTASQLIRGQWYFDTDDQVYIFAVEVNLFSIESLLKVDSTHINQIKYIFENSSGQRIREQSDAFGNFVETPGDSIITFNNTVPKIINNQITDQSAVDTTNNTGQFGSNGIYNNIVTQLSTLIVPNNSGAVSLNYIANAGHIDSDSNTGLISQNTIIQNSTILLNDNHGGFQNNYVRQSSVNCISLNGNVISNEITSMADLTMVLDSGVTVSNCILKSQFYSISFISSKPELLKLIEPGLSTFEATGDYALTEADYNAGTFTLTIPSNYNYFGVINLDLNNGRVINNIVGLNVNHPVKLTVAAGKTVTFHPTTIGSASANQIVLESLLNLTLTGYTDSSDYLTITTDGSYVRQIEASVQA